MVKHFFNAVFKFGTSEAQNELILAGENMVKNYKDSRAWEKLLVDTGDFFIKTEKEKNTFFEELACALSKENLSEIAKELKTEDGYDLESRLYKCLMQLMRRYEISYEIAESYTDKIIYTVLEQLRIVAPDKYEHYFLKEWKEEQNRNLLELKKRIDKMSNDLAVYNHEQISTCIQCLSPAKKYKLYKSSINKSIHFVQRSLSSKPRQQRVAAQFNLLLLLRSTVTKLT